MQSGKIISKQCKTCGAEFDGYASQATPVNCLEHRGNYKAKSPEERRQRLIARAIKWQKRNIAHVLTTAALQRNGDLADVLYECPCVREDKEYHHFDYTRPLEVIRLCPACHAAEHKRLRFLALPALVAVNG